MQLSSYQIVNLENTLSLGFEMTTELVRQISAI